MFGGGGPAALLPAVHLHVEQRVRHSAGSAGQDDPEQSPFVLDSSERGCGMG